MCGFNSGVRQCAQFASRSSSSFFSHHSCCCCCCVCFSASYCGVDCVDCLSTILLFLCHLIIYSSPTCCCFCECPFRLYTQCDFLLRLLLVLCVCVPLHLLLDSGVDYYASSYFLRVFSWIYSLLLLMILHGVCCDLTANIQHQAATGVIYIYMNSHTYTDSLFTELWVTPRARHELKVCIWRSAVGLCVSAKVCELPLEEMSVCMHVMYDTPK